MGRKIDDDTFVLGLIREPNQSNRVRVTIPKKRTSGPIVKIVNGHAVVIREQGVCNESGNSSGSST